MQIEKGTYLHWEITSKYINVLSRFKEGFSNHHYLKGTYCHSLFDNIYVFHSGRSYHGYIIQILTEEQWRIFMGGLLLFNTPKKYINLPDIVDARWVGHRLIYGYSSLRLSCNTKSYEKVPSFDLKATQEIKHTIKD